MIATLIVRNWEVLSAIPCSRPVKVLNALTLKINLSPSAKVFGRTPKINLTKPPVINITPIDAITIVIDFAFTLR